MLNGVLLLEANQHHDGPEIKTLLAKPEIGFSTKNSWQ